MPAEILESLRTSTEVLPAGAENRAEARVPVGTTVKVTVTPADAYASVSTMTMRIADYSTGGIGLLCGETVSIGSDVLVRLPRQADGTEGHHLRCSVASCRGVADGVFRVGVRFEGVEK